MIQIITTILISAYVLLLAVLVLLWVRAKDIPNKSMIILVVILAGSAISVVALATAAASEGKLASEALAAVFGAAVGAFGAKGIGKLVDAQTK